MMDGKNIGVAVNENIEYAETEATDRNFAYQLLVSDLERELARVQRWRRDVRPEPCMCASRLEQWEGQKERALESIRSQDG